MGRLSDADANNDLDVRFGGATSSAPATYYVGLSTTAPANDGTGITEPVGNGYARVSVANNATSFPAASSRAKSNGVVITFPTPTAAWGTVGWFVLMDASTAGAMHAWGQLADAQNPDVSSPVYFPAGSLVINAPSS